VPRAICWLLAGCLVALLGWWQLRQIPVDQQLTSQAGASAGEELLLQSSPAKQAAAAYFSRREYRKAQTAFQNHRRRWPADGEAAIYGENSNLAALSVQPLAIAVLLPQPQQSESLLRGIHQAQAELNYYHLDHYHLQRPMRLLLVDLNRVALSAVVADRSILAAIAPRLDESQRKSLELAKLLTVTALDRQSASTYVYPLLSRWRQSSQSLASRYRQSWKLDIDEPSWDGYNGLRQIDGAIEQMVLEKGRSYAAQRQQLGPLVARWLPSK
jgi:hypothetical protein